MWPSDRPDLKLRVVVAFVALFAAKVVTVLVPYSYKWATDALTGEGAPPALPAAPPRRRRWCWCSPTMSGASSATGFTQLRDALFARVGLHAVRQLAYPHLRASPRLSLRFHLERRTGGLSRVIERGTTGIENIVRHVILNSAPTVVEFALTAGIVWYQFGFAYVVVIAVTVALYVWFTIRASDWRISIRREMNDSDTDAHSKAIDSLLNYETVKYFGNEGREAGALRPLDGALRARGGQDLDIARRLNLGQAVIFGIGMAICMVMSARAIMAGQQTIGDFVLINALLMQLSHAAQLHRLRLPRDRAGARRHRGDVHAARGAGGGERPARRAGARGQRRRDPLRGRAFRLRPDARRS